MLVCIVMEMIIKFDASTVTATECATFALFQALTPPDDVPKALNVVPNTTCAFSQSVIQSVSCPIFVIPPM